MSGTATTTPAAANAAAGAGVAEPAARRPKRGFRLYAIVAIVLLGGLGAGGWFFRAHLPAWARVSAPAAKKEEAPPVKVTVPMGAVVVNIGRPDARRYLKI